MGVSILKAEKVSLKKLAFKNCLIANNWVAEKKN